MIIYIPGTIQQHNLAIQNQCNTYYSFALKCSIIWNALLILTAVAMWVWECLFKYNLHTTLCQKRERTSYKCNNFYT